MNIYPLPYSIPEEIFLETEKSIINKKFVTSPLIPGKLETYIYDNESDYYQMYRESKFGITHKKYGWDCLRHYEIIANKCIPLFDNLESCPKNTMVTFPRELLKEIKVKFYNNKLYDTEYRDYLEKIFDYGKKYLTCEKSAEYVLKKISCNKKFSDLKILFLSGTIGYRNVNYSRELLAIGMRQLLGTQFIDYPKINILYDDCKKKHKYVGKGFTYGGRLKDCDINRDNIKDRIQNKEFDFIIYGRVGKKIKNKIYCDDTIDNLDNLQYWDSVSKVYTKNEIVFIYGGDNSRDIHDPCLQLHSQHGTCFVRELE